MISYQFTFPPQKLRSTLRQSLTHAHWILESPRKAKMSKRFSLLEFLASVSSKSFLKFWVGIISLRALFRESRVNTKSPLSNGSTAAEIDLEHPSKTQQDVMSECSRSRILETSQRVKATGTFIKGCDSL